MTGGAAAGAERATGQERAAVGEAAVSRMDAEAAGARGSPADAEEAGARVRAVLGVGACLADERHALGQEARERLPGSSRLSRQGVALALGAHLETSATAEPEMIERFVGRAAAAARCHVILSANVCTAALRAIAFGVATSRRVFVKVSRRDPVVGELVVRALAEDAGFAAAGGVIERVRELAKVGEAAPRAGDEVHVYGADETIAAVRAGIAEGVALRAHGTGMGVAVIGEDAEVEGAARGLAADVVAFDQRGCLSPRAVIVAGGERRAVEVARALAGALGEAQGRVPRGELDGATRAELRRYAEMARALGVCLEGDGFVVGCAEEAGALVVPPAGRAVHVVAAGVGDLARMLGPWAEKVAAVGAAGSGELVEGVRGMLPRARWSALGWMQRPAFDGPVDLRAGGGLHQR